MISKQDAVQLRRLLVWLMVAALFFLTGAAWYFTPNPSSTPANQPPPTSATASLDQQPAGQSESSLGQALLPVANIFAPFLDVVPSQDGAEIFIKAGGVGQAGGTVFANVGVGPGHNKGHAPMVYSDTVYVATVAGFTPFSNTHGPLSITTTLGLNSGTVDFNRPYISPSPTPGAVIKSEDGKLELTLVSTDTFSTEAYVLVVPGFAPPGPPPPGHKIIGRAYSVRASGALTAANRPMNLRMFFDDIVLAGVDPHTLAIFEWNAASGLWHNIGGTLFTAGPEPRVSVATRRFTTYALMATNTWRDNFDEFSGLDFTQFNNVTFGGTPANRTLILANTPGSGFAVSQPISPTLDFDKWASLIFTHTADSPTTTLTVDILSGDGAPLATNVSSGSDLAGIDPLQYPGLRLRLNMTSTMTGATPALAQWLLRWQTDTGPIPRLYLPLVLKEPAAPSEVPESDLLISLTPPNPAENNPIQITVSGESNTGCIPAYESHHVEDRKVKIYVDFPPVFVVCPAIFGVPWSFTVETGPLPAGSYTVEIYPVGVPVAYGTWPFVVSAASP